MNVAVFSVMPSPYQRDVFAELAGKVRLRVYYQQAGASDSPWDPASFQDYERLLPGWGINLNSRIRFQFNRLDSELFSNDFVIVNSSLTSPTAQWLMRARLSDRPWVFWGERIRPGKKGPIEALKKILARPLGHAAGIAAVGAQAADDYQRQFPTVPVRNIPYGCDLDAFRRESGRAQPDVPVILYCGQMIPRKGVDVLLEAFVRLITEGVEAKLLLVGREGNIREWMARYDERILRHIEWQGFLQPDSLPQVFHRADIFVLPSRYDGWGVVVNQAMAAGLPVIATSAVGAAHDLVKEGVNGFVVTPDDAGQLAAKLAPLLKDPSLRKSMGQAAREKSEEVSAAAIADRWLKFLTELGTK